MTHLGWKRLFLAGAVSLVLAEAGLLLRFLVLGGPGLGDLLFLGLLDLRPIESFAMLIGGDEVFLIVVEGLAFFAAGTFVAILLRRREAKEVSLVVALLTAGVQALFCLEVVII